MRTGLLAAALLLPGVLAACGDRPAPPDDTASQARIRAPEPIPDVAFVPLPPPAPAHPEEPRPDERDGGRPAEPEQPRPGEPGREEPAEPDAEEGEWQPPSDWCGTNRLNEPYGPWRRPRLHLWHEVSPGLWRRIVTRVTRLRYEVFVEWGEDRDGRFVTWQEELDEGGRPLFGTERIPERPRKRPPR